ncbi:hypothetical protein B0T25DRAFT_616227 [Lasiosphaeria hispida]|uniref:Ankyrin repeat protein n=1 Tax=Lasiosphaeria hispida TaxID=260671 RepID=A0AAJ0H9Y1_9PEZI|nr:hypothetical protein B0T25DRAFT_616227 [Lasiosphaeria hispida]
MDDSGVYKSIRVRLKTAHKDGVKSVYHLALIIIDQCSRVFFDRTKSRDNRPEMLDLFGSAIGNMTDLTSVSYRSFWRHIPAITFDSIIVEATAEKWKRFLDINPEGILLQESQDIREELMILLRVYGQQITVVKEFRRHLATLKEEETRADWWKAEQSRNESQKEAKSPGTPSEAAIIELEVIRKLDRLLSWHLDTSMSPFSEDDTLKSSGGGTGSAVPTQEADVLLELIESRRLELQELEDTASRTCNQLDALLSLKQQQASILEAKAAKIRADESVKQGRSIIAFTVVTTFFLPLGFIAAFFGMNNSVATNNEWMTLNDQVKYMFGISAIVVFIAISLAFSQTARTALSITMLPFIFGAELLGLGHFWRARAVSPLLKIRKSSDNWRRKRAMKREQSLGRMVITENGGDKIEPTREYPDKGDGVATGFKKNQNSGLSIAMMSVGEGELPTMSKVASKMLSFRRSRSSDHVIDKV